ncbi:soluble lytic murein transglycosylase [Rubidibacter lacunae KORDI 51-2]|uniref:Soluble lytic murein transglycosylase n=2 Tax=Rubidibacter TaxID=582491 RepID=U5DP66_9CHRO|nr:soluble lytic murein transglycosylase [Rubidibacter lacunae KORDI 51-2]
MHRWDVALKNAETSGASSRTARQDGLSAGIEASRQMAKTDLPRVRQYLQRFYAIATKYEIPPAILAAIASRESRCGNVPPLTKAGYGDGGNGFGIMQVDRNYHKQAGLGGDPASEAHIDQAAKIYSDFRQNIISRFPKWSESNFLKGAAVAYNAGPDTVQTIRNMDKGSTGNDYGSDVIARAQFYADRMQSLGDCLKLDSGEDIELFSSNLLPKTNRDIEKILLTIEEPIKIVDCDDEILSAICAGLQKVNLLEPKQVLDSDGQRLRRAWAKFKKRHFQKYPSTIGRGSAQLLVKEIRARSTGLESTSLVSGNNYTLTPIVEERNGALSASSVASRTGESVLRSITLVLDDSVGRGGRNLPHDIIKVKQRLKELGFSWFRPSNKTYDPSLENPICLFQSIINGSTKLGGDGRIDVEGKTHQWLRAANAPKWIEMPIEGQGFINYERIDKSDDHDFGTSWLSETIVAAGLHYEQNHRRGNPSIAPIPINDVSLIHGGNTPDHYGHECGNACDIYLPRKGGGYSLPNWKNDQYDRDAARAILNALRAQPLVRKDRIFFNDSVLIKESLCTSELSHHHHIHFEIGVPDPTF